MHLAVSGSTNSATLTTTEPRSKRPGRGGGDHCQGEGSPVVGPCEEDLAGGVDTGWSRCRRLTAALPTRLESRAAGVAASAAPLLAAGGGNRRPGAVTDAGQLGGQARRQGDVDALQLLVAVGAGRVDRELGEGAALGVASLVPKLGRERPCAERFRAGPPPGALVSVKPSARGRRCPVCPTTGSSRGVVLFGPQVGGLVSVAFGRRRSGAGRSLNGTCGVSANVVVSCPVCGLALTLPIRRTRARSEPTRRRRRSGTRCPRPGRG